MRESRPSWRTQAISALGLGLLALSGCTTTGVMVEIPNSSGGSSNASAGTRSTNTARTGGTSARTSETSAKAGSTSGSARGGSSGEGGSTLFATTTERPSHCTNQTQDADESGVDCGGSACAWCTEQYAISPPDKCQNQFYYENCIPGDASTVCGGVCQPRNACENAPSKDGKVGFACSRYMMFSPPMIQASEDDAAANGWSGTDGSPFLYAVARHDMTSGDVDAGMVGQLPCCECYQLVFANPSFSGENASAQGWPIPRPLVVQIFNVGGGSDSFDLYVGAGGFGGLNACIDGNIRSSAGFALYDAYPSLGQPSDGGVKFSNPSLSQCRSATDKALSPSSVVSKDCQSKIADYCAEISSSKSTSLASTTRDSCIYGNQLITLYHQSWTVWAKRVACPENLTRVTGCRLAPESGLATADPNVSSAEQAKAAGFSSGYRTSTMQDCCKPACSWTDKVGGKEASKNVDETFSSFYACDATDSPMVE